MKFEGFDVEAEPERRRDLEPFGVPRVPATIVGDRVVQVDGRRKIIRDERGVREKFGVAPVHIPDFLALVGDAADGYPGIATYGPKTAAQLINRYGRLEDFPLEILSDGNRKNALLFKDLATLRTDAPLFEDVEELRWNGATGSFPSLAEKIDDPRLAARINELQSRL